MASTTAQLQQKIQEAQARIIELEGSETALRQQLTDEQAKTARQDEALRQLSGLVTELKVQGYDLMLASKQSAQNNQQVQQLLYRLAAIAGVEIHEGQVDVNALISRIEVQFSN